MDLARHRVDQHALRLVSDYPAQAVLEPRRIERQVGIAEYPKRFAERVACTALRVLHGIATVLRRVNARPAAETEEWIENALQRDCTVGNDSLPERYCS